MTPTSTTSVEMIRKVPHQLSDDVRDARVSIIAQRLKRDVIIKLIYEIAFFSSCYFCLFIAMALLGFAGLELIALRRVRKATPAIA